MTICKFGNSKVTVVSQDASLYEVADRMRLDNVGSVVVVKNKDYDLTPIGIVTDRDIVTELLARNIAPNDVCVKDILLKDLMTIRESYSIQDTIKAMKNHGVRRAPVINDENKVVGMVSMDDLLMLMVEELSSLVDVIKQQKL